MLIGMFLIGLGTGLLVGLLIGLALGVRQRAEIVRAVGTLIEAPDQVHRICAVCGQKASPHKYHDGRYLCAAHK